MTRETMRTWAEISLVNLEHNYHALRTRAPGSKFLGMVKADAYGHGAVPVAKKLVELGSDYLAAACLAEARELRCNGICAPILVLGCTPPEFAGEVVDLDLTQTVFTPELALALSEAAGARGRQAKIHLKVDTGMSRLGVLGHDAAGAASEVAALCALPHLEPEGIYTHFSVSDQPGKDSKEYTMLQLSRFLEVLEGLKRVHNLEFAIRHCANSGAVLNYPCTHLDMIRPGIALYGHYPDPFCQGPGSVGLRPVMSLKSRVAAVRKLPEGVPVSYGRTAELGHGGGRVAVLPVGYADGLHRVLSNEGSVFLAGRPRPIMGRVCMDMCMIGLDEAAEVHPGDVAEVFGERLPIETAAQLAGTIQYELLCAVAPRVPRLYLEA